jgi:hypothetical protein
MPSSIRLLPILLIPAIAGADESRSVPEFNGVHVGSGFKARVETGDQAVVLRGDPAVLRLVVTEVKDGKLSVQFDPELDERPKGEVRVEVRLPRATSLGTSGGAEMQAAVPFGNSLGLAASGGSKLKVQSPVRVSALSIAVSGGSTISAGSVDTASTSIAMSGSSRISVTGRGGDLNLAISGASELDAAGLAVDDLSVHASGSSTAAVRVGAVVDGALSGGSRVRVPSSARVSVITSGGAQVLQDL